MIKPNQKVADGLAHFVRQFPEFLEWFEQWTQTELEKLPYSGANHAVQSGRTQVLMEQKKLLRQLKSSR